MQKALIAGVGLLVVVALFFAVRFGLGGPSDRPTGLSGEARASFVRSAIEACGAARKKSPEDAGLSQGVIDRYCGCYAERLATATTADEFDRLAKSESAAIQAAMRPKMEAASEACADSLEDGKPDDDPKPDGKK